MFLFHLGCASLIAKLTWFPTCYFVYVISVWNWLLFINQLHIHMWKYGTNDFTCICWTKVNCAVMAVLDSIVHLLKLCTKLMALYKAWLLIVSMFRQKSKDVLFSFRKNLTIIKIKPVYHGKLCITIWFESALVNECRLFLVLCYRSLNFVAALYFPYSIYPFIFLNYSFIELSHICMSIYFGLCLHVFWNICSF